MRCQGGAFLHPLQRRNVLRVITVRPGASEKLFHIRSVPLSHRRADGGALEQDTMTYAARAAGHMLQQEANVDLQHHNSVT